jgi:hypothetical protein
MALGHCNRCGLRTISLKPEARWSEDSIAHRVWERIFNRRYLMIVPRCEWTGHECDLLVVTANLRVIDVEIKITRQDFRRDRHKDKWIELGPAFANDAWVAPDDRKLGPALWPPKVWKHYYLVPQDAWNCNLLPQISPKSGVIALSVNSVEIVRRARANKDAPELTALQVMGIARLAKAELRALRGAIR